MADELDIFLSYNSEDRPAVREVAEGLKRRRIKTWLDVDNLTPGRRWQDEAEAVIQTCRAAAVFVGETGIGPWEHEEMRALLDQAVERKIPLIPVLLPGASKKPTLPLFLRGRTWVDLRNGITPEGLDSIIHGITGKKRKRKQSKPQPPASGPPRLHNLPYPPLGDLLKGRDEELQDLAKSLDGAGQATAIVQRHKALYGLGGIGKTRLAVEYAWRFGSRYTGAFFVPADSPASLRAGLAALARVDLLDLPERKAQAEDETVAAVVRWLKAKREWLLILDNVDNPEAEASVLAILPRLTDGQVLITSRLRSWPPTIHKQALDTILLEEARAFLLKRTAGDRRVAADDPAQAGLLAEKLDGLPLALEQAGAYIAHNRLSFSAYLKIWEQERDAVLDWHDETMGYPASVAATWKASFDRLKPTAATILRLSAFLAPDPIPDALFESGKGIVQGAVDFARSETGQDEDRGSIRDALGELDSYSLISRLDGTFTVHRVVQEVLRGRISGARQREWFASALQLLNNYAPTTPNDVRTWPIWNLLRPHAATILRTSEELEVSPKVATLSSQLAVLLWAKSLYGEAEPLMRRALAIDETSFGSDHPNVAIVLNNLASLLQATNRLSEAEPLMRRALAIDEASFGSDHPNVAIVLNNLAQLLQAANRLSEAEPLMRRALAIDEASFGSEHPDIARDLTNLASLLKATNRLSEAEPLMRRALAIDEASFGSDHPRVAVQLNNLAQLLQDTNRLSEAEPLMRRALAIDEASFGSEHPDIARDLNNLALLLQATNRLSEAEPLMRRALAIDEASFGSDHPDVAIDLNNLAQLLQDTNRLSEAEPLMRRSVEIKMGSLGPDHPSTQLGQQNLALLLEEIAGVGISSTPEKKSPE